MDAEATKSLAIAIIMAVGTIAPAISIGWIGSRGADAIGRNPEGASKIQTAMIIGCAFIEALTIYALLTVLILQGKIG